jgi:nucleoside 2-deoxyribosyltransferase
MNETLQNDDINFAILAEIRRAQFVIADITGAREGVYFEAGFAKALGRDVFFTCRKDRFSQDKHFDTEHFHHTTWETPADLAKSLQEKVMALKGPGPHRFTQ